MKSKNNAPFEVVQGTDDDDVVQGGASRDLLLGWAGNDVLWGGAGADVLFGDTGDDTLVGGRNNDTLIGGDGADTFWFAVGREKAGARATFEDWYEARHGVDLQDDDRPGAGRGHDHHHGKERGRGHERDHDHHDADALPEAEFLSAYAEYVGTLVERYDLGADTDGNGTIDVTVDASGGTVRPTIEGVSAAEVDSWFAGRDSLAVEVDGQEQELFFLEGFRAPGDGRLTGQSGVDGIHDFDAAEGDKLAFAGLTAEEFAAHFTVQEVDVLADGRMDTVIRLKGDPAMSVTLLGVSDFDVATDVVFG